MLLVNILSVGLQAEGARVGLTGVGGDQARTDLVSRASCDRQPPLPAGTPQLPVSQSGWAGYFTFNKILPSAVPAWDLKD